MAHILGIDADSDLYTRYVTAFREKLVFSEFPSWLRSFIHKPTWPTHSLQHLVGKDAVQPDIDNYLVANKVDYITVAGHGVDDTLTGYERALIWKADQDLTYLRAPIVHFLACQTGAVLGQQMVRDGVRAFWGYTAKFRFFFDNPAMRDLSEDYIAGVFIEMDCLIDVQILNGSNAEEIYKALSEYFKDAFYKLKNDPASQALLLHNYRHLVGPLTSYGDPAQTL